MWFWQRWKVVADELAEIRLSLAHLIDSQKSIRGNQATMQQQLNLLKLHQDAFIKEMRPKLHTQLAAELPEEVPGDDPPAG